MARYVITGTGTDIGKTVFAAGLTGMIGASYWKPVQTGVALQGCDVREPFMHSSCTVHANAAPQGLREISRVRGGAPAGPFQSALICRASPISMIGIPSRIGKARPAVLDTSSCRAAS